MSRPARSRACLFALALCLALPVHAAEPAAVEPAAATAIDADLVGHYSLSGVMETGSELLLRPDGRFQWYLAYGALDLTAEGRWSRDGTRVLLDPDKTEPGAGSGTQVPAHAPAHRRSGPGAGLAVGRRSRARPLFA